jgi:O-antigen/teichoic acid export membrane protein
VSVGKVAQLLLNGMEVVILGWVLGPVAVVVYACTGKTVSLLANQVYLLATTADPALGEVRAGGSRAQLARVSAALSQLTLLASGLVAVVVLATNEGFVGWWVGAEQYGGNLLTAGLLAAMLVRHLTFTLCHLLFCFGHERALAFLILVDGAVTVAAVVVLAAQFGPLGAPLGSLLGVCLITLPGCLILLARECGLSPLRLLRCHFPWLWRVAGIVLVLLAVGQVWRPRDLLGLAAAGAGVGLVYAVVMLPMSLRSELGPYLRPRLLGLRARLTQVLSLCVRKA